MEQYFGIKEQHPDAILLFRVGDFYETFSDDAIRTADVLGIVLTSRNNGGSKIELAGFPYHSLDVYLPRLVKAGHRVAICEQLEKPSKEKKIVRRGITDLVTPGLTINNNILDQKSNNYLCSIHWKSKSEIGIAFIDISTGDFTVSQGNDLQMQKLIQSLNPTEIIYNRAIEKHITAMLNDEYYSYSLDEWVYGLDYAQEQLHEKFEVISLKGFGIQELELAQIAAGSILHYLKTTENHQLNHIKKIARLHNEDSVWMDRFTIRNLELVQSLHPSGVSLAEILDQTQCPMGSRLLKKWILFPLVSISAIENRLSIVEHLTQQLETKDQLSQHIKNIGDLERISSRLAIGKVNPRDFLQMHRALLAQKDVKELLHSEDHPVLRAYGDKLQLCEELVQKIDTEVSENCPTLLQKGGVFKEGFNAEYDEITYLIANSKNVLLEIQTKEAEATGITNLKIGFNNVFGYYLEVTNKYKNLGLIPDHWVRKQTLTNAERYITEELKVLETKILNAETNRQNLEEKLYTALISFSQTYVDALLQNARIVASLDCLLSFASCAIKFKYNKPVVSDSFKIDIKEGRHPVIEQLLPLGDSFIPNDIQLDTEGQQVIMITGPNMSGKSAVLRQTALICLMAQMGSFVPATTAEIGLVDKLFTRVGASDNISSGESTFMVEMNETASIMNNISARSLVLLDEIGRGTSTYDGISIAWSLAEFIHNHPVAHARTLFATHYHELNELSEKYPRIKNYNVATREVGNKVIFLRKLKAGGSKHSFGIHVAKMAGMPKEIINRAQTILLELEKKSISQNSKTDTTDKLAALPAETMQLSIFEAKDPLGEQLKESLIDVDINSLTPVECMMKLKELTEMLRS